MTDHSKIVCLLLSFFGLLSEPGCRHTSFLDTIHLHRHFPLLRAGDTFMSANFHSRSLRR